VSAGCRAARTKFSASNTMDVWRPTGIRLGSYTVCHVHRRHHTSDPTSRFVGSSVRRRHQVYGSCRPANVVSFSSRLSSCVDETSDWMKSNRLQSNPDKAEVLWCTTSRREHQLSITPLLIDGAAVDRAKSVRDLGIYIDSDLVMRTHVQRTVSQCFAALRQLRQIRRSVPPDTFQSLTVSL